MLQELKELMDVDCRLNNALKDLRSQQVLIADISWLRNHAPVPNLLSSGLRQFRWLEDQHLFLQEAVGEYLPLRRE